MSKVDEIHETITNKIIEELEKGNIPWKKPWKGIENNPKNLISGKAYSGINFFLLSMSGCSAFENILMNQNILFYNFLIKNYLLKQFQCTLLHQLKVFFYSLIFLLLKFKFRKN